MNPSVSTAESPGIAQIWSGLSFDAGLVAQRQDVVHIDRHANRALSTAFMETCRHLMRSGLPVNALGAAAAFASYMADTFIGFALRKNEEAKQILVSFLNDHRRRVLNSETNFVFFHLQEDVRTFAGRMRE